MINGKKIQVVLFADYYQVHIFDDGLQGDFSEGWTNRVENDLFIVRPGIVIVGTVVNVNIAVSVEVLAEAPSDDKSEFDHVAEGSIYCSSGQLVIMGCTDFEPDARRVPVVTGWLRLRAAQSNLDRAYETGPESDEDLLTMEQLRVQVWPEGASPSVVTKRWRPKD